MRIIDYTRSFLQGKAASNRVRFVPESRTRIINADGSHEDFVLCAACKSEDTFAASNLFYEDNYDFKPVFGTAAEVIFRRKAYLDDRYRTIVPTNDTWGGIIYRLTEPAADRVRQLDSYDQVRAATDSNALLVAQTQWRDAASGLSAIIEYPVKTMNVTDTTSMYQVDTGPIAFADLAADAESHAHRLALAYIAFNVATFADFVIEAETSLAAGGRVMHYSKLLSVKAENRLYAIDVD